MLRSYILFVLNTPDVKGTTQAAVASSSMGVSPSRLLYGPTANYGSIIIACICHRRLCLPTNERSVSFIAPSRCGRSWRTHFAARIAPMQVTYLCAVYSVFKDLRGLLFCPLYLIAEKNRKN